MLAAIEFCQLAKGYFRLILITHGAENDDITKSSFKL